MALNIDSWEAKVVRFIACASAGFAFCLDTPIRILYFGKCYRRSVKMLLHNTPVFNLQLEQRCLGERLR